MTKKTVFLATLAFALSAGSALAQNVELRMSWWGGDSRHAATQEALKLFEQKNPGITVKAEFTGFNGHQEKLATQVAGSTEPDLMQVNWNWLTLFSQDGSGFADLEQFKDTLDLGQWAPELLDTGRMNGTLNGVPVSVTGRVFFMNATTYEKAGLAIPKTWAEIEAATPVFKEKLGADYYPFDASRYNSWLLVNLYAAQKEGKGYIDTETNTVAWSPELLTEALNFYQGLVDKGVMKSAKEAAAEGNVELYERNSWADGKLAGSYEWDSTFNKYADPLGKDQVLMPIETPTIEGAVMEGNFRKPSMLFAISKNSQHKEEAAKLLNFLMNDPEAVKILGVQRGIPASKVALSTLMEANAIPDTVGRANAIVMAADVPEVSPYFEHPEIRSIYEGVMEEFAYGQLSAEEAATIIVDDTNAMLRRLAGRS